MAPSEDYLTNEYSGWQEREVELWAVNDYDVLRRFESLMDNYAKKWRKGTYDPAKAAQGIVNLILPAAIKKIREVDPTFKPVSKAQKKRIAKSMMKGVEEDLEWREGEALDLERTHQ